MDLFDKKHSKNFTPTRFKAYLKATKRGVEFTIVIEFIPKKLDYMMDKQSGFCIRATPKYQIEQGFYGLDLEKTVESVSQINLEQVYNKYPSFFKNPSETVVYLT